MDGRYDVGVQEVNGGLLGKKKKKKKKKLKKGKSATGYKNMIAGDLPENQQILENNNMGRIEEALTEQDILMSGMESPLSQQASGAELNFVNQLR